MHHYNSVRHALLAYSKPAYAIGEGMKYTHMRLS